ncbi:MAG: cyclase [Campylobacterales bacterium]|nr:cyclase [Campylobacterales bacterium]
MAYMMVRHKVRDFNEWKPGYDGHKSARDAAGLKEVYLLRNADAPHEVIALFEATDLEKARTFGDSKDLKQKMQEVGIIDWPDIYFLE